MRRAEAHVIAFGGIDRAATRWQLPIVLAWASTAHGAQGWTLDSMAAVLNSVFASGQFLSALSRTRRLCDKFLVGFDKDNIIVSTDALLFCSYLIDS